MSDEREIRFDRENWNRWNDNGDAFVVGVTGRRHIVPSALPAVEASARRVFRALEASASDGEIWVATGLAIGSDQLAARVVEDLRRDVASRLRLLGVLPMSAEEYASDFSRTTLDESAKSTGRAATSSVRAETSEENGGAKSDFAEFRRLLTVCDAVVELPLTSENAERRERGEKIDRSAQYSALADFLVDRSRVLAAFWSGNASERKPGGTVDVVLRKLERREPVLCVATPEVLRFKNPDGSKTLVPEPTENAGKIAFWTKPPKSGEFEFDDDVYAVERLFERVDANPLAPKKY